MSDYDKVLELLDSDDDSLMGLAKLSGTKDIRNFYRGADFRGADLTNCLLYTSDAADE